MVIFGISLFPTMKDMGGNMFLPEQKIRCRDGAPLLQVPMEAWLIPWHIPYLIERAACVDDIVAGDVIVIPYGGEPLCTVTGSNGFHREWSVAVRGAAMNDNLLNLSWQNL